MVGTAGPEEAHMMKVVSDPETGCLEIAVDGPISVADYQAAVDAVDALLKQRKHINVVEIVKSVGSVSPEIWWKDMLFRMSHHNFLHRVAVVSDLGWVGAMTRVFSPLFPAEVKMFAAKDVDAARSWAKSGGVDPEMVKPHLDFA